MPEGSRRGWLIDAALLFALTAYLIWPWFQREYVANWGSIESTFISDGRYLREHLPHPQWQPNWYCGTRFDYIYPPALRYGTALISAALDVSAARAYRIYTGLFYALGIAGVYVLFRVASGRRAWAWLAAIAATSLAPSFLFLKHFAADYRGERMMPVRWGVLVRYGEGPHSVSFAILSLALAAAWLGLRRGRPGWLAASAALAALVVSNNFYGATALAHLFPIVVWVVWITTADNRVWLRAAAIAALAYGLTAVWLTPSFLAVTLRNMKLVSGEGNAWSPLAQLAVLAVYGIVAWRLAWRRPERAWPALAAGMLVHMSLLVLGHYYLGFRVIGEPERLVPEFDQAFLIAATGLCAFLWSRHWTGKIAVAALLLLAIQPSKGWVRRSWQYISPPADHAERFEHRLTSWIATNLPGQRILATGSLRFWFNAWHDIPQLGGGSEQGTLNLATSTAYLKATYPLPAEQVVPWMQALGTDILAVAEAKSQDHYHDVAEPERFHGKLQVIHDDGDGNLLYRIPRKYPGLARVVTRAALNDFPPVVERWDDATISRYAAAVETNSPRDAAYSRPNGDFMRIQVRLLAGEALVVQESFDPAWRATSHSGAPLPTTADPIGFILVEPGPGDHTIDLRFEVPAENRVGQFVTGASLVILALLGWRARGRSV